MRLDALTVELRPRSPWEAAELGIALVRRHRRAIWGPMAIVATLAFVLVNAIGWFANALPLAMLGFWWLKPVFDRVPLFVLSRAVFGDAPDRKATLAAQRTWGWRTMAHHLTWRRLSPFRGLYLPVDLLEGGANSARRAVVGGRSRGVAALLATVFANFEMALLAGLFFLLPIFLPEEYFFDVVSQQTALLDDPTHKGLQLLWNVAYGAAVVAMEPFFVGAGFGLYLARRTQLEAWDVEIAFRRMRERLRGLAPVLLLAVLFAMPIPRAEAQATTAEDTAEEFAEKIEKEEKPQPPTLPRVFGDAFVPPGEFERQAAKLEADPDLHPVEIRKVWKAKSKEEKKEQPSLDFGYIGDFIALVFESGMWILVGLLLIAIVVTRKRWWPWFRNATARAPEVETPVDVQQLAVHDQLPDDVPTAARALWRDGQRRRALALLYRASVATMSQRTGTVLVPGATEAECLRAARGLRDAEERDAFAQAVRTWQYAAYADRMPDDARFATLVDVLAQRFGWAR